MDKFLTIILGIGTGISSLLLVGEITQKTSDENKAKHTKTGWIFTVIFVICILCNIFCSFVGLKGLWEFGFWFLGD